MAGDRCPVLPALLATLCAALCLVTAGPAAAWEVRHPARAETVEDFGALIPMIAPEDQEIPPTVQLERVTTAVPWGRGLAMVDGELIVLSRGRHRSDGGVSQEIVDAAGTLWRVDVSVAEPVIPGQPAGEAVRANAEVFAPPVSPPFHLYAHDRPPVEDTRMDRPYCTLAFDAESRNLFICAYAGAELETGFRKHATDAVFRYDLRDGTWRVVEQHDPAGTPAEALGAVISNAYYPHHDPASNRPPHGWLNGPDGCTPAGKFLYVPAKDNHVVVQYDLDAIRADPAAPPPDSRPILDPRLIVSWPGGEREMELLGPSAVGAHGGYLYIGYRTSSVVVRVPLDAEGEIVRRGDGRIVAELIAVFEPWDPETKRSGNLFDLTLSPGGELFVSMGTEGKVWRFRPDPARPFYGDDHSGRTTTAAPFLDLSALSGKPTGCNNVLVSADGYLYVSTRNNDAGEGPWRGTVYRARIE